MLTDFRLTTLDELDTEEKLRNLLKMDLDFHNEDSSQMSHDFHAFPAKFPPQLPRLFINNLTNPGEKVLDPMMGSGTCVVEAVGLGREGIGLDIDPLAVMLSKVKLNCNYCCMTYKLVCNKKFSYIPLDFVVNVLKKTPKR